MHCQLYGKLNHHSVIIVTLAQLPFSLDLENANETLQACVITTFSLQSDVKKPRCTKYTHHVQLQEGGGTYQRTAELTIKQSAVGIATPLSPSLSNRSVSLFSSFLPQGMLATTVAVTKP